jgi:DNA-binding NarL/FixJ family response regulator
MPRGQVSPGCPPKATTSPRAYTRRLVKRFALPEPAPAGLDELTPREREVLRLLGGGLSNTELAARLQLSEATVKTHVARIFAKLGLRDRAQNVVIAYESGLVVPRGS